MEAAASLPPVRIIDLLIQRATRNEEVKGLFKGLLGIVEDGVKAIPAGGPQRTGGILEPGKVEGYNLIGGVLKRHLVHQIGRRIVLNGVALDAATEAADALQIGFHIGTPLSLGPGGTAHLEANGGICGEGGGASGCRGIQLIAHGIGADAVIIDLVEIIIAISCKRLLFCGATHTDSSLSLYYSFRKQRHHPTFLREDYRGHYRYWYRQGGLRTHL